ncbi:MAG: CdaR family protein [Synergistes jonesii]|uniref:CdaR family protein n=1 Tax=Synergistes jonesii TaxID=2754 RepID=UPI002A74AC3B|nr:CdaR family protein [Synergistes jonesii]MDY2984160.1 CdaR family protein [Synergistes jonesii]
MPNEKKTLERLIIGTLNAVDRKLSSLSGRLNYKGESILQSKGFFICVSVFISVALWAFVALDSDSESARTLSVEINYANLPAGFSLYAPTNKIELKISGKINMLSGVRPSDLIAEVDLANLQAGKYTLPINLDVPSFARVISLKPAVAEVEVYRHVERTVEIKARAEGAPPEGMILSSITLDPASAVISGPENEVLAVQGLEAVVALDKLDEGGKARVSVALKAQANVKQPFLTTPTGKLTITPKETNATVAFENEIVGERIPVKISVVGSPQEDLQVESIKVIPESVSIRGRSEAVKRMQSLVLPPVDITGLDQNIQIMIPMRPEQLEEGVEISGPDRARVEIRLSKKMGVKTFTNVPLLVEGSESGKEWKLSPQSVSLTVEGTQTAIDSLTDGAPCELYVDVSNIVSQQTELPVLVKNLKRDFQIVQTEPEQVRVTAVDGK